MFERFGLPEVSAMELGQSMGKSTSARRWRVGHTIVASGGLIDF